MISVNIHHDVLYLFSTGQEEEVYKWSGEAVQVSQRVLAGAARGPGASGGVSHAHPATAPEQHAADVPGTRTAVVS